MTGEKYNIRRGRKKIKAGRSREKEENNKRTEGQNEKRGPVRKRVKKDMRGRNGMV